MSFLIDFLNFILLGVILSLTARWALFKYRAYQLKSAQKEPLDRMIRISSKDILKGVIRKRAFKAVSIAQTGIEKANLSFTNNTLPRSMTNLKSRASG